MRVASQRISQLESGTASGNPGRGPGLPLDFGRIRAGAVARPLQRTWSQLREGTFRLDDVPETTPWTDDRAPVELLTDQVYRALRPAGDANRG